MPLSESLSPVLMARLCALAIALEPWRCKQSLSRSCRDVRSGKRESPRSRQRPFAEETASSTSASYCEPSVVH